MAADRLPDETLIYTLPSRYCLPDVLADEAWRLFGSVTPGYGRVQAICDHVHEHLTFEYGSTSALSTASDVNTAASGCAGTSHIWPSRSVGLSTFRPATCSGTCPYMDVPSEPELMDFAAWMEVWLDDRWWTFDPRNNVRRKGRTVIGRGRDASDVAMATTFGGPRLNQMTVTAREITAD